MKIAKSAVIAAALTAAISIQAGAETIHAAGAAPATAVSASVASSPKKPHDNAIYNQMMILLKSPAKQAEAISYLEKKICRVTPSQASTMVLKLEDAEKANLDAWNNKFYKDSVQSKLMKLMKAGDDLTTLINKTSDKSLKSLFKGARDSGYRLETSEGMFYLVLDYPRFQKVRPFMTDDIKSYIDIMTTETKKTFANDAALSIGWTEVTKRALSQEVFLKSFPSSSRAVQVKLLYKQYLNTSLYGLNNTPLFDYDTKKVDAKAKAAFEAAISKGNPSKSSYLKTLKDFLDVLQKNHDTLTPEVEKYRKSVAGM
ncbi:hypothetical protein [Paenibacillus sp.]|jgi:hypothetical protein|uniref:hypothetical protein n=1 Tax=Paenibacillus sp. TaxID=58172 RepID=UPI00281F5CF8|nr:hypothetical protein [Paenibacillus sp.]MDR0266622.1 hypothetical protein [Paenibacillus sp.]